MQKSLWACVQSCVVTEMEQFESANSKIHMSIYPVLCIHRNEAIRISECKSPYEHVSSAEKSPKWSSSNQQMQKSIWVYVQCWVVTEMEQFVSANAKIHMSTCPLLSSYEMEHFESANAKVHMSTCSVLSCHRIGDVRIIECKIHMCTCPLLICHRFGAVRISE
jgi:hypothetical protein